MIQSKIIKETETEIWVKGDNRTLHFWKHGEGFIPLHEKPSLDEDFEIRILLKWRKKRM